MFTTRARFTLPIGGLLLALASFAAAPARAVPDDLCRAPDVGIGTSRIPPAGCSFLAPEDRFRIIDGLPPGTTIELEPILGPVFCQATGSVEPCLVEVGGNLGGEREVFDTLLAFSLVGKGDLAGFERVLGIPLAMETHSGPRTPGDPVQSFDTDVFLLQGQIFGDPDFASLQVVAGSAFGLPSPGTTTLFDLGDGTFQVDSFFDIAYQISFEGAPGGALEGLSGSTQGLVQVEAAGERSPCIDDDSGTGTVALPTVGVGCDVLSPEGGFRIVDGMPPGTTIEIEPRLTGVVCAGPGGACSEAGGALGGEVQSFEAVLVLQMAGTNDLDGFRRTIRVPMTATTETAPRSAGAPVQSFDTEMFQLQGQLFGDPDFATLQVTAGSGFGLPSPGRTTLTDLGDGTFEVDSFFDIAYRIDFTGAPGGSLEGLTGSTSGDARLVARSGKAAPTASDDGTGTATLPAEGSGYASPDATYRIVDGLPSDSSIELEALHHLFFCTTVPCSQPGGGLGGTSESFDLTIDLELRGTGALSGFDRVLQLPASAVTDTGPRATGSSIDRDLVSLQGSLFGDPDFSELTLRAGAGLGLPSPGATTLTDLGSGTFRVDSFFDVEFEIDFVGAAGGPLDGLSGTTGGELRITSCDLPDEPEHAVRVEVRADPPDGTDFSFSGLAPFALDDDADGTLPRGRTFFQLPPGTKAVTESAPEGWEVYRIQCEDPDGGTTADLGSATASIDLDLGETVTCVFFNASSASLVFTDGFESGDTTAWSSPPPP